MIKTPAFRRIEVLSGVLGCVTIAAIAPGAPVPLRAVLTFAFCGICPGLVAMSGFAPRDRVERIVIAIGLSLAIDTVISELLAVGHEFTALRTIVVLTALIGAKSALTAYDIAGRLTRWRIVRRAERATNELGPWA